MTGVAILHDGLVFPECPRCHDGNLPFSDCHNGTVITNDHRTMIVTESREMRLTAITIGDDGLLTDRRLFARLGPEQVPDGICLDQEGCIRVAAPRERSVLRVAPGGDVIERLQTDAGRPHACMLGGPQRRDLFICLAGSHDPEVTRRDRGGRRGRGRRRLPSSPHRQE